MLIFVENDKSLKNHAEKNLMFTRFYKFVKNAVWSKWQKTPKTQYIDVFLLTKHNIHGMITMHQPRGGKFDKENYYV